MNYFNTPSLVDVLIMQVRAASEVCVERYECP